MHNEELLDLILFRISEAQQLKQDVHKRCEGSRVKKPEWQEFYALYNALKDIKAVIQEQKNSIKQAQDLEQYKKIHNLS